MDKADERDFDPDLFAPFERLVEIELLGRRARVPERNTLLRGFQYLSLRTISYGDFCWNGDCANCRFWYREEGEAQEKTALACRFTARDGLTVTRLSPHIRIKGVTE